MPELRPGKGILTAPHQSPKGGSMKMELMEDLYLHELRDLYDAEKQLLKTLPKMAQAIRSSDLRQGFENHAKETEEQIHRLEKVFKRIGESPSGPKCEGMAGLLAEGEKLLKEDAEPELLEAGLIAAAQKIEHYEIAGYGCVCTYAKLLGFNEDKELLGQTLQEEKSQDGKLTLLAESINLEAAAGEMPEDTKTTAA
jgi:ferritin-like metal-binding protein YciE